MNYSTVVVDTSVLSVDSVLSFPNGARELLVFIFFKRVEIAIKEYPGNSIETNSA